MKTIKELNEKYILTLRPIKYNKKHQINGTGRTE